MTDEGTEESRWYRFNDTVVDEFVMNDDALAAECFGGSYKSKATDGSKETHNMLYTLFGTIISLVSSYMETKVRFWNAYMLFYKAKDLSCTTTTVDTQPQVKAVQDKAVG